MTRYQETFLRLKQNNDLAFIPFWMIGDPTPEDSLTIVSKIAETADILELGIPFSDPLADGPAIQGAVNRALGAGTTTDKTFDMLSQLRQANPSTPIGLLVYLNLILSYGEDRFFAKCAEIGIDSILVPELPVEEIELLSSVSAEYKIPLVFLVSTNTPADRLQAVIDHSTAFIYVVSTPSITGTKTDISPETISFIKTIKQQTDVPLCVGFGISSPEHLQELKSAGADGGIIGSKIVSFGDDVETIDQFCQKCKRACSG